MFKWVCVYVSYSTYLELIIFAHTDIHALELACVERCEYTCLTSCILFEEIQLLLYIIILCSVVYICLLYTSDAADE